MAAELAWIAAARNAIGEKEVPGNADNPTIMQFFVESSHTEIRHDEVPWCAAFVNSMLKRGSIKGNNSLSARSFEQWGQPLVQPIYGCVGVKRRSGANPPPGLGHVGFVVGANAQTIFLLGGNQSNEVSIAGFRRSEFTAFRYPANITLPNPALTLPTTSKDAKTGVREA